MIVAVDFDGCLSLGTRYPSLGRPNLALIQCLDQLHELGHTIILWTCREGPELEDAVTWCKDYHVPIDYVNENPPWLGFKSRKVVADWYIDDLCVSISDIKKIKAITTQACLKKYGNF